MDKMYIGIDPGKTGAMVLNDEGKIRETTAIPLIGKEVDVNGINKWLENYFYLSAILIILEKGQAMKKQGVTSMFNYGRTCGLIEGVIVGNGWPYVLMPPQTWQKEMFVGTPAMRGKTKVKPKERALIAATRLWPDEDWRKSERATKPHDGIIDAALIAEYARRKNL